MDTRLLVSTILVAAAVVLGLTLMKRVPIDRRKVIGAWGAFVVVISATWFLILRG